jgi:hypothetical protein
MKEQLEGLQKQLLGVQAHEEELLVGHSAHLHPEIALASRKLPRMALRVATPDLHVLHQAKEASQPLRRFLWVMPPSQREACMYACMTLDDYGQTYVDSKVVIRESTACAGKRGGHESSAGSSGRSSASQDRRIRGGPSRRRQCCATRCHAPRSSSGTAYSASCHLPTPPPSMHSKQNAGIPAGIPCPSTPALRAHARAE